jgi:hypothetical protein
MNTFVITMERRYRKFFIIDADTEEQARELYAHGEHSGYWTSSPEIVSVEAMTREQAERQLDLFTDTSCP